jgi:flavin reductase
MGSVAYEQADRRPAEVTQQAFRDAMAVIGAAVHIITTDGPAGAGGFTASAVTSVTDTPPSLLVCINRNVSSFQALIANGVLCVNTLSTAHRDVSRLFSQKVDMAVRFSAARWRAGITGAPLLMDAVASFDCRINDRKDVGTHAVLFCDVLGVTLGGADDALIYHRRAYHGLGTQSRMDG